MSAIGVTGVEKEWEKVNWSRTASNLVFTLAMFPHSSDVGNAVVNVDATTLAAGEFCVFVSSSPSWRRR
jgi:hypothetical protein